MEIILTFKVKKKLNSKFARICPYNSYARKNIGYLIAFSKKINFIVETDDDNGPKKNFLKKNNSRT